MEKSKIHVVVEYEFRHESMLSQAVRYTNEVFGEDVTSDRTRRWYEKFPSGDVNLVNESLGRLVSKVGNDKWKAVVEGGTQTKHELAASSRSLSLQY